MDDGKLTVRRAAVLGAGVMGAQIAAHLTAAGIPVRLFDLPGEDGDRRRLAREAIARLRRLKPAPLAAAELSEFLEPANFEDDLARLTDCDLIIEAVAERMDIKRALYQNVSQHLPERAVLASNTSGLSIGELAGVLPEILQPRFCGVHFFNPPRYMHLVELIAHTGTDPGVLDGLEAFLTRNLGKGVVRAKDTPNFIANRIGVFAMLSTIHHAGRLELGFDTVDALTGPAIGRPKSATLRLADVVGLDTMASVIATMCDQLSDDPWHPLFQVPDWMQKLVDAGALGQKSGAGVYRKEGREIRVLDPSKDDYRAADYSLDEEVGKVLGIREPGEKLLRLAAGGRPELEFLWSIHRDLFHYCAVHLASIAESAREVDSAMRWGYGWKQGPFELWQAAGWSRLADRLAADIEAGAALADTPLPGWVGKIDHVHGPEGSYSAVRQGSSPRPDLPVYRRQYQPTRLLGEDLDRGSTVSETDGVRLWHLKNDVLLVSFKTRMSVIDPGVIDGLHEALRRAAEDFMGLVIWQPDGPFSAGADLKAVQRWTENGDWDAIETLIADFQRVNLALRYAATPSVAAVRGLALGGGLEVAMHCTRVVAALESRVGLVEAGVGLLPAAGGLATTAFRTHDQTQAGDPGPLVEKRFRQVAMGRVSGSALEAVEMGYFTTADPVVLNEHELLHAAHAQVRALDASGYRPPLPGRRIPARGDVGIATLKMLLANMHEGRFISDHDREIAGRIAEVLCGGQVDRDTLVDEEWLHRLEREHFMALVRMKPTRERIEHMLKTGKPLRN